MVKVVGGGRADSRCASPLIAEQLHRGYVWKTTHLGEKSLWDNAMSVSDQSLKFDLLFLFLAISLLFELPWGCLLFFY